MLKDLDTNKIQDVIYLDDVQESMIKGFKDGYEMGKTTHFREVDEHFRWLKKNLIMFAGYGNHGKSTVLYQMLLARAIHNGQKSAVFSPENLPANYFYDDLIHTMVGKSTIKQHDNQMTMEEYMEAMAFIKDHFYLIYPEHAAPTPEYINVRFKETIDKYGVEFCVTDPFNQLDNHWESKGGRDDKYLSSFLSTEKRFAQDNNIHKIIVGHCSHKHELEADGTLKSPTVFNLNNGAMWNNKVDDIIIIHRPYKHSDSTNHMAYFISDKIKKQRLCGTTGRVVMSFDSLTNRFSVEGRDIFGDDIVRTVSPDDIPF